MGSFRRVLYDVLIGITLVAMYSLAVYLGLLMPNVTTNALMSLALSLVLATLYTIIIALLLYLRERSEHKNQGD
jgi:hypothetical protein